MRLQARERLRVWEVWRVWVEGAAVWGFGTGAEIFGLWDFRTARSYSQISDQELTSMKVTSTSLPNAVAILGFAGAWIEPLVLKVSV